ncbi:PucR family transcriptional regulator [Cloacibacillus sp.]
MDERGFFQFLVDVALTADSFQELLRKIAENLKSPACFKDANGTIYIESDDHVFSEQVGAYPLEELRQRYFIEKIRDGERLLGHFLLPKDYAADIDGRIDSAVLSIRVYCARKRAESERRQSAESDVLQRFLTGKLRLERAAAEFKERPFPLERGSMVAVIGYGKSQRDRSLKESEALSAIDEKFGRFFKRYVAWHERKKIVIAFTPQFPMDEGAACDFIEYTIENIKKRDETGEMFENLRVGFSSIKNDTEDLPKSYEEAEMAFRAACLLSGGGEWCRAWRSLGAMRLLMLFAGHPETDRFVESVLGKLITESPKGEYENLLDTLECIEKNSWNLKQSSVEMNFHYNTLKYRYQRIQEILDIDLALPVNRFNVALALKLYSLRGR